jgi:hypothetical protein
LTIGTRVNWILAFCAAFRQLQPQGNKQTAAKTIQDRLGQNPETAINGSNAFNTA